MELKKNTIRKTLAHIRNPLISAALNQNFVFKTKEVAADKIKFLRERFVKSRFKFDAEDANVIIWIEEYELTDDEKSAGAYGNFALLAPYKREDGKYTIIAKKINADLKYHPKRKRENKRHPDWGYPVLRRIRKGWVYANENEANAELLQIAEDFPEVSIPGINRLYTMIYSRPEADGDMPIKKYAFKVRPYTDEKRSGVIIEYKEKIRTAPAAQAKPVEVVGNFTKMIELKRKKKRG